MRRCLLPILLVCGCGRSTPAPAPVQMPQRIVSLTLATDELLAELVPPERIAGVTYLVDDAEISNVAGRYPAAVPRLRDTAPERVLALGGDLVCVAPYNSADFLHLLEHSGVPTYRNSATHSLDEIEAGILALGERIGEVERARQLVERMQQRRERLARRLRGLEARPRVLFWSAGFTAGSGTIIDDLIRAAGGRNAAAERGLKDSTEMAPEQVIATDPDYVLTARWAGDPGQGSIAEHPLLRSLPAVRDRRVIVIEGRYLLSVSHHVVEGAERLAAVLHPEAAP
jgi:iron complex transport system substrate-binding protein